MIHDVIVVGSGPGGATAAAALAAAGKSVLLADRQSFPRDKVCGDGLPVEVMRLLCDMGVDIHVAGLQYQRVTTLAITGPGGRTLTVHENATDVFSMTAPRLSFDHMLHQHALRQGAQFEVMHVHKPLQADDGRVVGVVERRGSQLIEHEARVVIAAGGVGSPITRALNGRSAGEAQAVAIRAYARLRRSTEPHVHFFFKPGFLPGYGWVFSIAGGKVNVGVYLHNDTYRSGDNDLRALLDAFCAEMSGTYDFEIIPETVKSWPLPIYTHSGSRTAPGVLIVGDEGRFTNALTGGGIYFAMRTGQLAAAQALKLLAGETIDYDTAWREAVAADLRRGRFLQQHIASRAPLFNGVLALGANPLLKYPLMKAIAGDHY